METEITYRISAGKEAEMKAVAYAVYGANFLIELILDWVGIGEIVSPVFMAIMYAAFALWFNRLGVKILGGKVTGKFLFSMIISVIPIVNLFYFSLGKSGLPMPGIVKTVEKIIALTREEDEENAKSSKRPDRHARPSFRRGNGARLENNNEPSA